MALMDLFVKKRAEPNLQPQVPVADVPVQQVVAMQAQGLSNNQIIQSLQNQGYPAPTIYDAIAQAEVRKNPEPFEAPTEQRAEKQQHPDSEVIVEQLIEEKWHELQKELAKTNEWKDSMSSRLDKMEQSMADMKGDLDGLHKAIVARIGEYDKTLLDVGTEIKAMEKVFQKVLPELTGNIQELSRITKTTKENKTEKKGK
ncbi:hypothetical protein J4211_06165 [Candidatus Woesearchaeota archaeon]|nr:hypothetical protein [Candidatus Woesearchaeota archaeon]